MEYEIKGTVMQSLEMRLKQGETVYTEAGGMAWMTDGIDMKTSGRGGIGKMLGRALSGESLFLTNYTCTAPQGMIVFVPEAPGKIIPLPLQAGHSMIAQRDAFMCAEDSVQIEMHFRRKLGTGFFGGEGFVLQKITGPGIAFVEISGEVAEYNLQPGQRLKVDPGHIAMYEPSVNYDIQMVKGITNMFFGGEGLFLATLTGPGRVWLQTMPVSNLAQKILSFMPKGG
ncbi:MAG: TIGR00266 family protein [Chloroflexi bacterium]|nr:TIGR00266 family protein [Anaerolineae bacterium]MCQ3931672.1 TIGR00266 family protein [Chloroflexota bacterium]